MYDRILVPIDGCATAEHGLRAAIELAVPLRSSLVLLHVLAEYPTWMERAPASVVEAFRAAMREKANAMVERHARLARESGLAVETLVRDAFPRLVSEVVVEEAVAQRCSLIVMGTHGRRGFDRFTLGSDAELVARTAPVPLLLIRHPDAPQA